MSIATSAAVLAGGQSSRMGTDKAFVMIRGVPLIAHVLKRLKGVADETLIIANGPLDHYAAFGLPVYPDVLPGKGPLGGIYTALIHAHAEHTLIVAVDMPFLAPALLAHLLTLRTGYDVVVPRLEGYPQGTLAVYGKSCLEPIRQRLEAGELKLIGFYDQVRVRSVDEAEMRPYDPDLRSFANINTPGELSAAAQDAPE